jgi:hypothetical protein
VTAHTKVIGNSALCFLFPCLIAWTLLAALNSKNKILRQLQAIFLAFTAAVMVFTDVILLSVAAGLIITVVLAKVFMKRSLVPIATFFICLTVFIFLLYRVWKYMSVDFNLTVFSNAVSANVSFSDLMRMLAGRLYYFTVSTWGMGVLAICLFATAVNQRIKLHFANTDYIILTVFAVISLVFTLLTSLAAQTDIYSSQEALLFGLHTDYVTPLLLISVICYIYVYDLNLREILSAVVAMGGIFTAFFSLTARTVVHAQNVELMPIIGLYPLRIGVDINTLISLDGLFLSVSAVFCFMALLIVFVCCGGRYRKRILSGTVATIALYCCVYTCAVSLPLERRQINEKNAAVYELSELLYNSSEAPAIIAPEEIADLLQFLNQNADIRTEIGELENYFLIEITPFTSQYTVHPVGEKAVMYELSQNE